MRKCGASIRPLHDLRSKWSDADERAAIIASLEERGIAFDELAAAAAQPDADPFDLLCHVAYNAPLRTRRERAEMLKREKQDFFEQYSPQAREVLEDILEKYIDYGTAQFQVPEILKVPPISKRGTVIRDCQTLWRGTALAYGRQCHAVISVRILTSHHYGKNQKSNNHNAPINCAAARQPDQILPRYNAQRQGIERRP